MSIYRFKQLLLILCLIVFVTWHMNAETFEPSQHIHVSLVTDLSKSQKIEQPFFATLIFVIDPGWHLYWKYPGDSGLPIHVAWRLPHGWRAEPLEFSIPQKFNEPGNLLIFGYEKLAFLRSKIIPISTSDKHLSLQASVSWLGCKEQCVPGKKELIIPLDSVSDISPIEKKELSIAVWPSNLPPHFPMTIEHNHSNLSVHLQQSGKYDLYPLGPVGSKINHPEISTSEKETIFTIPSFNLKKFSGLLVEESSPYTRHAWKISEETDLLANKPISNGKYQIILVLLFGFLGGLILNMMPCVLPVISLKIFGFIAQAGDSPKRILRHGLAFMAGIFAWFLGFGFVVILLKYSGSQVTWGAFQFQNIYFVISLSLLVFFFALNLFGIFELVLPGQAIATLDKQSAQDGYIGSFLQGLFATVLATPCTAPFLGSALGFAFTQNAPIILSVFFSIALGMSLPYLILCLNPRWRKWIPKPGVWMERLKQLMGFPLLITDVWLLSVLNNQKGFSAVSSLLILFIISAFLLWIYGLLYNSRIRSRTIFLFIILAIFLSSIIYFSKKIVDTESPTIISSRENLIDWVVYSPESLQNYLNQGKAVFLDFTATWCLTCQFNEHTAISTSKVSQLFKEKSIIAMKADWTNSDPTITEALKSFGRVGIPLAIYYPPHQKTPIILPELLTEKIIINTIDNR